MLAELRLAAERASREQRRVLKVGSALRSGVD